MNENTPVLEIIDLSVAYLTPTGSVEAVRGVNLSIYPGEIIGLVGESGSGKSTMAFAVMRLLKGDAMITGGTIKVLGKEIYSLNSKELKRFRWDQLAMVFQSAMSALNPVMTVENQILDTILSHRSEMGRKEALKRAEELMDMVRIDRKHLSSYPHELSGGMRQRIVIAIAISLHPKIVIMDEPTTALDVVVQRSILDQIREIQKTENFSILFISHDFSLVAEMASRVAIMYAGRIVELTDSRTLNVGERHHPYTEGLLRAIPQLTAEEVVIEGIAGNPPDLKSLPSGCAFHPRCSLSIDKCHTQMPVPHPQSIGFTECHLFSEEGSHV